MIPWRFLNDGRCPAHDTMAKDTRLFAAVRSGSSPGFLRIYNWAEPAVTIGYHQKSFTLNDPSLKIPVLRRPTGGGAVLHEDDITFSIGCASGMVFPAGILECSRRISELFAGAFRQSGLDVLEQGGLHAFSEVCFARPSPVELMLSGSKLMGLALARKGRFLLVQGVIPLKVDRSMSERVFGARLTHYPMGVLDRGVDFSVDTFINHLRQGLASALGILLHEGDQDYEKRHDTDECEIESR